MEALGVLLGERDDERGVMDLDVFARGMSDGGGERRLEEVILRLLAMVGGEVPELCSCTASDRLGNARVQEVGGLASRGIADCV